MGTAIRSEKRSIKKLKRVELFEIMVAQKRELEENEHTIKNMQAEYDSLSQNYEKLRKRLDEKDAKIKELKDTMQRERENRLILLQESGNIAEASLRINNVFEAAQRAADQYLENVRRVTFQGEFGPYVPYTEENPTGGQGNEPNT